LDSSYGSSIINLLIEKLSDNAENVVLESLNSLQQMMEFLSIKAIIPCMTNLLVKLRPCFDINNHMVRSMSFNLFNRIIGLVSIFNNDTIESIIQTNNNNSYSDNNNDKDKDKEKIIISGAGSNSSNNNDNNNFSLSKDEIKIEEIINDQIHSHLVSLLLHVNDENPSVRNNCFKTLVKAIQVIVNQDITCFMNEAKSNFGEDHNRVYDELMISLIKIITEKYPNKINHHISNCINHSLSSQDSIRASSVYLIGLFYKYLSEMNKNEYLKLINLENIFNNFNKLLKDFSNKVKIKAIKSIAYFKKVKKID
jgi:hypothetical protein